MSGYFYEIF